MQYSTAFSTVAFSAMAMAAVANQTVVTTQVTVTGYTTYCPEPTVVTITKCVEDVCHPSTVTVTEPTTLTITEECLVSTTYTKGHNDDHVTKTEADDSDVTKTEHATKTDVVSCDDEACKSKSKAGPSTVAPVSTFEGAANMNAAGGVALAAVAAIFL